VVDDFAALFMQAEPVAPAVGIVILHPHADHSADAREGVNHGANQGAVAQVCNAAGINRLDERAGLFGTQHRHFALFIDVFRALDGCGRIALQHPTRHQPVETLADGGQVLLDGGRCARKRLDISGDNDGIDGLEIIDPPALAPGQEAGHGPGVGLAGGGGEEFDEGLGGALAGTFD
jgi:glyoxylase-like metal-dependent hydrolase (beta-lactamase superfamily II)